MRLLGGGRVISPKRFYIRLRWLIRASHYRIGRLVVQLTNTSALCVFDAQRIAAGPIGRAQVSPRVPVCFDGTWRAVG